MIWSAFLLGLISSLHCVGMCAPLQLAALGTMGRQVRRRHILLYHGSRILTYGILGLLAGLIGRGIGLQNWQQQTSLLSGLFLLLAFAGFYFLKLDRKLLKVLFPYLSRMRRSLSENRSARTLYFSGSGVINGLLPCGMVYLAIFPAMSSGNPALSSSYMLFFGLGTLPLLLLTNLSIRSFLQSHTSTLQKMIPAIVVITALLLILRGMDLGIPYLSPETPLAQAGTTSCH